MDPLEERQIPTERLLEAGALHEQPAAEDGEADGPQLLH